MVLSDDGYKTIPVTDNTTEMLFILFQATRFTIGHWIMIRLKFADHRLGYFDTTGQDQDPSDKHFHEACQVVMDIVGRVFTFKGLAAPKGEFTYHREQVRKHHYLLILDPLIDVHVSRLFSGEMERVAAPCHGHT